MADSKRVKEQLKEITDRLEQGIMEVFESEKYKEYLDTMSKFYNYSFNNTMLIAMQKPDATLIAGYKAWPNKFERHVRRGEKGIRIIAPAPVTVKEELEKLDPVTQEPMLDAHGNPVMEEVEIRMPNFKVISVFDVSQTEGKELPDLAVDELTGDVEQYDIFMQALTAVSPVPIGYEEIPDEAKGYYHLEDKRIALQEGMSQIQNSKTAIHEIAHATLHDIDLNNPTQDIEGRKDRKTKEVEAESIAYAVCQHYGIDTSDYSFGYVAGWSSDKEMKELKSSLETIRKTSATLIHAIDERMSELQHAKVQEVEQEEITEPIRDDDVIVMVSASMGSEYEIDKISNMGQAEVRTILEDMTELPEGNWGGNVQAYLEYRGAEIVPLMSTSSAQWDGYPTFYDFEYSMDTNKVYAISDLSPMEQVENMINRMEFDRSVFNDRERNLLTNYTYKFANMDDTRALAIELRDALDAPDARAIYDIMERAEAEIEALPDQMMSFTKRNEYGYTYNNIYPLTKGRAVDMWEQELPILLLHTDNTEAYADSIEDIIGFDGIFGIEQEVWERVKEERREREPIREETVQSPEDKLLHGEQNSFGIYQLKEGEELHYHRFEGLERLRNHGLKVEKKNYELIYTAPLQEGQTLDDIFEQFNLFHPEDFTGHSLSVSDIVLIHKDGVNTAQYVDSFGFQEISDFLEVQAELEQQTEAAYEFADRYLMIHECEDGYDYTFYNRQYQEMDGGVYENPDITLDEAVHIILTDDPFPDMERAPVDYEELDEKVEEANRIVPPEEPEKVEVMTEKPEQFITFYVAECMEFTMLGEYHENLTMEQAVEIYHSIPAERMHGGKGIGFVLHNANELGDAFQDMEFDLYSAGSIDVDTINHIPEFRDSSLVQQAIEDVKVHFPVAEVWDRETKAEEVRQLVEQFATDCEQYAIELDQFFEDYDTYEYRDSIEDKEENVQTIAASVQQGDTAHLKEWLQSVIEEEEPIEDVKRAEELLKQLDDLAVRREKNPLTKVEEQEEVSYDQIDGMLNNMESEDTEQIFQTGISIADNLAEKKKQIARGGVQEKPERNPDKKLGREMD
ncbi:MAG: YodL domain-containing protein [Hespellia sp.]|nr:YodL domain-containing protein [Hespellia sp.]